MFNELPAERFLLMIREVTEIAVEEAKQKQKQSLRDSAFQAFLQGVGGEMDFESFLIHLGLHEASEEENNVTAEEAKEKARSILKSLGN